MLLLDWLQDNVFIVCTHMKMAFFHVYMTTTVSVFDIFQIILNDCRADISFVTFSHHVDGGNS